MGRRENPIPDPHSPEGRVATHLRGCREAAGRPTYKELQRRTGYSDGVLSQAASGLMLPSREVVQAYVGACGGNVAEAVQVWLRSAAKVVGAERAGDPSKVHSPETLVHELVLLARSAGLLKPAAIYAATRRRGSGISRATFYRLWRTPREVMSTDVLSTVLAACDVDDTEARSEWMAAHARANRPNSGTDNSRDPPRPEIEPAASAAVGRELMNAGPGGHRSGPGARHQIDSLFAEIKRLRQGRGIYRPDIDAHVGPCVRELSGINDDDSQGVVREKIVQKIGEMTVGFPDDLRIAVKTALGMNDAVQHPFLSERIAWLAEREQRDHRAVTRQVDNALRLMCQFASKKPPQVVVPAEGWHVRRLTAFLRLDGPTPVCQEMRTIVADQDGLVRVQWSISLPKPFDGAGDEPDIAVVRGVVMEGKTKVSAHRWVLHLRLPRSLDAGETHDFGLEIRVPGRQAMRPAYVFWPAQRCEQFNVVIRFPADQVPGKVWRVSDVVHGDIDDIEPRPAELTVNGVGEVEASFQNLQPDRGYGIQWRGTAAAMPAFGPEVH